MKKTLSIIALVTLVLSLCMFPVSAANKIYFTDQVTSLFTDGGYYAKGGTITVTAHDTHGITVTGAGDRLIWAFENATADANPYLVYKINDPAGATSFVTTRQIDVLPEVKLDMTAGFHCVNLSTLLEGQSKDVGYTYIMPYVNGTMDFDYLYLSDVEMDADGNPVGGETPVKTGAESAVAAGVTLAVAGLATVVVCSKKSK